MIKIKNILNLFTLYEKKRIYLLLFLIFITTFVDLLGISSVLPFVVIISNPQLIETNEVLILFNNILNQLGINTKEYFIFFFGFLIFFFLIASIFLRGLAQFALLRFCLVFEYSLAKRLIENYLNQPYIWFLGKHSATISKNILSEVGSLINGVILQMTVLISQSAITIGLLILLFIINPYLLIIVIFALLMSYMIIFFFVKKKLKLIGNARLSSNDYRYLSVTEAFGSIKEIKLRSVEEVYINRFTKPAKIYADAQILSQLYSQFPRYLIESVAFGGMILLVLFFIKSGNSFNSFAGILTLYAFAGYRLIPALQNIYYAIAQIRFSWPSFEILFKDLNLQDNKKKLNDFDAQMQMKKSIVLDKVYFDYPNSEKTTLKNIQIEIPVHKKVGILGPSGCGKSTVLDIILGLIDPTKGKLIVDGQTITHQNKRSWQKNIGYVPQNIYLSNSTIAENIAFGVNFEKIDHNKVVECAKLTNLDEFIKKELPDGYKTIIGEKGSRLSGGQKQRIGIARSLYHEPKILIFDEATNALDILNEDFIMDGIYNMKNKITIILVTHRIRTVKKCDIIFLLDKGEVKYSGNYEDIVKKNNNFYNFSTN
jgi:ATP-binding cassette, subfamily B, bacterial PglK